MVSASVIRVVLFDYGGVLAEEGFREGLMANGRQAGLDPAKFFSTATKIVYDTGYVVGRGSEAEYWHSLRERSGITSSDEELRREILDRFVIRPGMLEMVGQLRAHGIRTAILSDQTNWLDELETWQHFFHLFETVINSFHSGLSKRDPITFQQAAQVLDESPTHILFVDDNPGNIQRAEEQGLAGHLFVDEPAFHFALVTAGLLPRIKG